ncbi:hypothetical protein YpB42003004_3465 [Yersinia pestis biovar Antiqua str. B42003004]|uniref:Uncharacterized protein n=1 Tax=Yersinia pestis biovar Orientalis str. IP275 TaxID=373665 RepID=A0AAV3BLA3_YERPE|nr:hypothetical protein YpAngola_A1921 [Yersinia pestis Angola]EDR30503.1 hypothetical protein YPIP275_4019 [Yersinia pestis biovar Orientalis str. IP275]EDR49620.1 hypothetical protein YpB42003004_3722 [Yersinia pestis biovar Antiqua str. B42003004]EIR64345.1 hypothetical protein YPPY19_1364 [Yersinia pestis PY-19]EIT63313.1 hypothetical protein YPPY103_0069 [Yersinia pestis PY-103]
MAARQILFQLTRKQATLVSQSTQSRNDAENLSQFKTPSVL